MACRGRIGGTVAFAVTALLLIPASASALSKATAEGESVGGEIFSGTAKCKAGQSVVSGGFSVPEEAYAVVNRAKGDNRWTVTADNTTALTVFAYCSRRHQVSRESSEPIALPDDSIARTAKAKCGQNRKAVSGGWAFKSAGAETSGQPVFKSRRKGTSKWAVTAFGYGFPVEQDRLTAFAYCLKGAETATRSARSASIGTKEGAGVVAKCKRREELLGGGFTTSPKSDFSNLVGPDFFYFVSARQGKRGWKASAHNYSNVDGRIKSTAICAA